MTMPWIWRWPVQREPDWRLIKKSTRLTRRRAYQIFYAAYDIHRLAKITAASGHQGCADELDDISAHLHSLGHRLTRKFHPDNPK